MNIMLALLKILWYILNDFERTWYPTVFDVTKEKTFGEFRTENIWRVSLIYVEDFFSQLTTTLRSPWYNKRYILFLQNGSLYFCA